MKNLLLFIALAAAASSSCTERGVKLSGAGATFPAPFYNVVCKEYATAGGGDVSYGGTGSGGGIRSLMDKTVDFGGTDVFLSDAEMLEMGAEVIHVPTAMGAVALAYNLDGVDSLRLTAQIVSAIYRGEIKTWNDPLLQAVNPDAELPALPVTPVYRSDGSGTTAVFSEYMSTADSIWRIAIGSGKSLSFVAGVAAKGNPGVAGVIAGTKGAVGYIGSEYAMALSLPSALLRNADGRFVGIATRSIAASAPEDMPDDTRIGIVGSEASDAYPIATFTWIIAYKEQSYNGRTQVEARALSDLLLYIVGDEGQAIAEKTYYVPLPPTARAKAVAVIRSMTFDGEAVYNSQARVL
ncbi:MAG: phosphate ABC transporter substrate-binding protein PstS [Tannerellaceae bacterium]|jgi:phosphate transport system substrate-binding protein|nr:phosphate ABC transporter substrate-binding protein PstS [Tannerellaceae bacterium]